jgi:3-oxoacyl-[acyl-carrier-protein] synthase-3
VVEYSAERRPAWFALGTDGSGAETLMVPAGRARLPLPESPEKYAPLCAQMLDEQGVPWRLIHTYMDGGAVFDFTLDVVPGHIQELLRQAGKRPEEIDRFVLHQANRQIMRAVAEKAGLPLEKTPMDTFGKYGNQASASIPSAICDALAEEVSRSSRLLLLSGFGVGLSWASAVLELGPIRCDGVRDFIKPANHPSPEDFLERWQRKITGLASSPELE